MAQVYPAMVVVQDCTNEFANEFAMVLVQSCTNESQAKKVWAYAKQTPRMQNHKSTICKEGTVQMEPRLLIYPLCRRTQP